MKVCHLMSGDLWAGPEVMLYNLAAYQRDLADVELAVILLNEGKLAERLRELGVEVQVFDETERDFFALKRRIIDYLKGKSIDILHSHRYKENILAAMSRKPAGVGHLVQTVHGIQERFTGFQKFKAQLYTWLNRRYTRRSFERVFVVSRDIQTALAGRYPAERLVVTHNAINPDRLKPRRPADQVKKELDIGPNNPIFGTAGRMVPIKGYDVLLNAFARIADQEPRARLLLTGDGPQKIDLERQAERLGLIDKVRFAGFRDDIVEILNVIDIFVMSSHHEGIPMILLEAMGMQKPVVVTAVGGMKEVIEDQSQGRLVPPGNPEALAEAALEVLRSGELRSQLGLAAKRRIKDEFSVEVLSARLLEQYRRLTVA
jgi:glycosyltransferase involved in cell wall biosynthesis